MGAGGSEPAAEDNVQMASGNTWSLPFYTSASATCCLYQSLFSMVITCHIPVRSVLVWSTYVGWLLGL